jgi:small subunit ribosomal protein S20
MPVIKSAIKKQRQDKVSEKRNDAFRKNLSDAVKKAGKTKSAKDIITAISLMDKSVKKNLTHKNKAARVKSRLSKLAKLPQKVASSTPTKKATKSPVKPAKKAKK